MEWVDTVLKPDEIKKQLAERFSQAKDSLSGSVLSVKETLDDAVGDARDVLKDITLMGKVKEFSVSSVNIVAEIDQHLSENAIPYEVSAFRVNANMGVMAGMMLEIQFAKTTTAKKLSDEKRNYLVVQNPNTGKSFKLLRSAYGQQDTIKVRDPETQEVLFVSTKTGQVITESAPDSVTSV